MGQPALAPTDDRGAGRDAILDAGEELFADKGFAGTSLRALARAAGTSQALIHHHFGTKAGLWAAVKARFGEQLEQSSLLAAARIPPQETTDPVATLADAMRGYAMFLRASPRLLRIAAWARLEGDDAPWQERSAMLEGLRSQLIEAQAQGLLRADLDVGLHLTLVGGTVDHWVHHQQSLTATMQLTGDPAELSDRYFEQAARSILLGALPDGHSARTGDDR